MRLVLRSKESKSDLWLLLPLHLVFDNSNAVIFGVDEEFVLLVWINNDQRNLIILELLMHDNELIRCSDLSIVDGDIPASDVSNGVSNEESTRIVKGQTVRVDVGRELGISHKVHIEILLVLLSSFDLSEINDVELKDYEGIFEEFSVSVDLNLPEPDSLIITSSNDDFGVGISKGLCVLEEGTGVHETRVEEVRGEEDRVIDIMSEFITNIRIFLDHIPHFTRSISRCC